MSRRRCVQRSHPGTQHPPRLVVSPRPAAFHFIIGSDIIHEKHHAELVCGVIRACLSHAPGSEALICNASAKHRFGVGDFSLKLSADDELEHEVALFAPQHPLLSDLDNFGDIALELHRISRGATDSPAASNRGSRLIPTALDMRAIDERSLRAVRASLRSTAPLFAIRNHGCESLLREAARLGVARMDEGKNFLGHSNSLEIDDGPPSTCDEPALFLPWLALLAT